MADQATTSTATEEAAQPHDESAVVEDVLVEEVSIDGMCGVY